MASNKTNGSLHLYPMNSNNYTAANAGVSNSDTDKQTLLDDMNNSTDNNKKNDDSGCNNEDISTNSNSNRLIHDVMKSCVSEEDMIPPYDYTLCKNNSLLNNSSAILASGNNSLDLKPQKKHNKIDNLDDQDNGLPLTTIKTQSTNDTVQTQESTDTQHTQETSETNENIRNVITNEQTRQLSNNSSNSSHELMDDNPRKEDLTDNAIIEKNTSNMSIHSETSEEQQKSDKDEPHEENKMIQKQPQQSAIHSPEQLEKPSIIRPKAQIFQPNLNNSEHIQRQVFEQKVEQKKMDQFRRLNQMSENKSKTFAKSMSPMSPKSTAPFTHKLPTNASRQQISTNSSNKTTFNNSDSCFPKQQQQLQNNKIPTKSLISPIGLSKTASGISLLNNNSNTKNTSINTLNDIKSMNNNNTNNAQTAFSPPKRNASPFRDPSNLYLKQINDQQRPLYTPAVLRVMKNTPSQSSVNESGFDVYSSPSERPILSKSTSTTSIRSTSSSIMDYWNYLTGRENSQPIDGPTRKHWKPDSSRFNCAQCGKLFNFITDSRRKHHCRSCGEIFCGDCLKNYIYLDEDAKFTLFGSNWEEEQEEQEEEEEGGEQEQEQEQQQEEEEEEGEEEGNIGNNNPHSIDQELGNESRSNSKNLRKKSFILNDKKYLCKACLKCFQRYEEYVLDHTTRDHNLGADGKDIRKKNNTDHNDQMTNRQNIPVDWDWSSF